MLTVDRRSDVAAALCYTALTPPGACRSLWMKHCGDPSYKKKKQQKNGIWKTNLTVFRDAHSGAAPEHFPPRVTRDGCQGDGCV